MDQGRTVALSQMTISIYVFISRTPLLVMGFRGLGLCGVVCTLALPSFVAVRPAGTLVGCFGGNAALLNESVTYFGGTPSLSTASWIGTVQCFTS